MTWASKSKTNGKTAAVLGARSGAQITMDWAPKREAFQRYDAARSTTRISLRMNSELLARFKAFSGSNEMNMSEFFEWAGLKFLHLGAQQKAENDAAGAQADDVRAPFDNDTDILSSKKKMLLTSSTGAQTEIVKICELYCVYNEAFNGKYILPSPIDFDVMAEYADAGTDLRIVELGILYTQINKLSGGKVRRINSFKFYTNEIENLKAANLSDDLLNVMLESYRRRLQEMTGRTVDLSFLET